MSGMKVGASCQTFQLMAKPGLSEGHFILESLDGSMRLKVDRRAFPAVVDGFSAIVTLGITQIMFDETEEPKIFLPGLTTGVN